MELSRAVQSSAVFIANEKHKLKLYSKLHQRGDSRDRDVDDMLRVEMIGNKK
jgi:hypothetical protein